jgi:hypothetical protein
VKPLRLPAGEISQRGMPGKAHPIWESSLRRALQQYLLHYHEERNHQGKENRILFPFSDEGKKERGSSAVPGTPGRPAEVLRAAA